MSLFSNGLKKKNIQNIKLFLRAFFFFFKELRYKRINFLVLSL